MTSATPFLSVAERRRRLGVRHALAAPVTSVLGAAGAMVALHSSDPIAPYLALQARVSDFETADLEIALYERMELIRLHGMRRTLWIVPAALADSLTATAATITAAERRRTFSLFEDHIEGDAGRWLEQLMDVARRAVGSRPGITTAEVGALLPPLRAAGVEGSGASTPLASRVLLILAMEGAIRRHRPLGSWVSSQYRWIPATPARVEDPAAARADLVHRWLTTFGPGTLTDLTWWTGWGKRLVRIALESAGAVAVALADGDGFVLDGDTGETASPAPWVALLPGLDPTVMGWKDRRWFLGEGAGDLFDRNGNAGPTVWADGRVVGGWAQRSDGRIAVEFTTDVGGDVGEQVEVESERLQRWLGESRVNPRFPSPMSRRLAARRVAPG